MATFRIPVLHQCHSKICNLLTFHVNLSHKTKECSAVKLQCKQNDSRRSEYTYYIFTAQVLYCQNFSVTRDHYITHQLHPALKQLKVGLNRGLPNFWGHGSLCPTYPL